MKYEIVARPGELRRYSTFIVPVYSDVKPKDLSYAGLFSNLLSVDMKKIRDEERFTGGEADELVLRTGGRSGLRRVIFMGFGKQRSSSTGLIRRRMQRAGQIVRMRGYRDPVIVLPDYPPSGLADGMEAALVGFQIGAAQPLRYKTQKGSKTPAITRAVVYHPEGKDKTLAAVIQSVGAVAPMIAAVRDMVDQPPNLLGPEEMARRVTELVAKKGVSVKVHKKGLDKDFPMVAWVGRGSARPPLVVELTWAPQQKGKTKHVVLVGKGVIFDSGGLNIKSFHNMGNMKDDMAGAAVVAAVMAAAADMKLAVRVTALLPLAENTPSADAYRPSDILTSRSGKTVEVTSTDAEGRLIMADALSYGAEKTPDYMIDVATLTGACIIALGPFAGGLFASDDMLAKRLEDAAASSGEMLWRLPLLDEMMPFMRSDMADMRNTLSDPYGGAIGAALFLREFTGGLTWAHLDIAGPAFLEKRSDLGPRGATGFGVHTLVRFLRNLSERS
jgi:leucyl aminopeptidase